MSVVHIKFLKKNCNLQWNYKDYGHDLGLGLELGLGLAVGELVREHGSSL